MSGTVLSGCASCASVLMVTSAKQPQIQIAQPSDRRNRRLSLARKMRRNVLLGLNGYTWCLRFGRTPLHAQTASVADGIIAGASAAAAVPLRSDR